MKKLLVFALLSGLITATSETASAADRDLLKRLHGMRVQMDNERTRKDNDARANGSMVRPKIGQTASRRGGSDAPTVNDMRSAMSMTMTRFQQSYRCLEIDAANENGNTVVVCGDNNGTINNERTEAGRDIITVENRQ